MRRVPLLLGSRVVLVPAGDEDVLLVPPPPPAQAIDVEAAVRDALRFPLSGPSLEELVPRRGRVTVVVEPPALPLPGAQRDPRADALAATLRELERARVSAERMTILVAGGLSRRLGRGELERLLPPATARAYRGSILVHDAEADDLVPLGDGSRASRALVESDLVVTVTAAETVAHGAPGALVGACDAVTIRRSAGGRSLLEAAAAPAWSACLALERALSRRVPTLGVSLVLDLPRLATGFRDCPHTPDVALGLARSWVPTISSVLPNVVRAALLERLGRRLEALAAYAGPPSVAHAEALVRGIELRGTHLAEPVDGLVLGIPWLGPHLPRSRPNPITAALVGLGLAARQYRDTFPVREGGTVVLLHPFTRTFARHETPYLALFDALRARNPEALASAERLAGADAEAIARYRRGDTCHPLLPFADWAACAPTRKRVGNVIVAGCRDALAARALGFVPSRSVSSALEMAHGLAAGRARLGVLLAPPYPPLIVGSGEGR